MFLALAMTALTACTGQSSATTDFNGWYEQMRTVFDDSHGMGGAGGATPGSVELGSIRTGEWVVYAVCTNTDVIHIRIRGGSTTLAETDVPCGATIAVPITVDRAATHRFQIQTSHLKAKSGAGWWSAQVNSTSWKQAGALGFA